MLKVSIYAQSELQHLGCWNRLDKLALFFLYNFHRKHSCVKLKTNKKCHKHVTNAPKGIGQA